MRLLKPRLDLSRTLGQWTPEPIFRDKTTIDGLTIFLAGIQASHPDFGEVTGSAAEVETHPIERAWYEMVERISIMEKLRSAQTSYPLLSLEGRKLGREMASDIVFPIAKSPEYQYAKSNGVALHRTWDEACRRAAYELVERHLVLSSWVGLIRPLVTMEGAARSPLNSLRPIYEVKRVHFGTQAVSCFASPITVSAVALVPREAGIPLIVAFGAGHSSKESLRKAESEAIQRLGFLWGESLPQETVPFAPNNLYHQDYHLHADQRDKLEGWLSGAFYRPQLESNTPPRERPLAIDFVDLTVFPFLDFKVARAICPEAIPLVFGRWREREFSNLPDSLLIHPIA